jgi:D-sedoheptulose 7-phosphate isomerase
MSIKRIIQDSISIKTALLNNPEVEKSINEIVSVMVNCYNNGGKVLFCGNGGSAADAQHLAAELSGRFYFDREPLNAEALHVNSSYITAVGNDYSFDEVYARIIKAKGKKGDVLVGISTSGSSKNIVRAFEEAKKKGVILVSLTGKTGGELKALTDYLIAIPSTDTPRIQECHILIGHIICELVEENLFTKGDK